MNDRQTESVPFDGPAQVPLAQAPGTVLAGRYELTGVLGIGGSSVVYRATDRLVGRPVALKLLRRDRISAAAVARLRREVSVTRNVGGEHLVRIFDIGTAEDDTFVTMELVEGESLRALLERGPLPLDQATDVARQLLSALATLHGQQIVHRDVKPSNVLIDAGGCVKLADFGLAVDPAADGDRPTQTGTLVGTAEYMSPEQITGKPLDARSDLYSFGVLLYECLTGQLPFGSRSSIAALIAHVHERPRAVTALRPDVPRWLSRLVGMLLEKDPALRLSSAGQALAILRSRRAPRSWKRLTRGLGVVAVAAAVLGGAAFVVARPRKLDHLRPALGGGIEGLDRKGHVLWRNMDYMSGRAAVVRQRDGGVVVVAAPAVPGTPSQRALRILDPATGKPGATVPLMDPAPLVFPQFADVFSAGAVSAVDLDRDGDDEVIVTYVHTYWPAYTVVYDFARRAVRVIFANSGGHRVLGTADVNGDGRQDVLVSGVNNRMGWYSFAAAIDAPPATSESRDTAVMASSPDAVYSTTEQRAVFWYLLLPPQFTPAMPLRADPGRHAITIQLGTGGAIRVSTAGFLDAPTALDPARRRQTREEAYSSLRRGDRLAANGSYAEALRETSAAAGLAHAAGDPYLEQWARRVTVKELVRLGDVTAAEREAHALLAESRAAADVTWDAAHELHLTGQLERAVYWYRQGLFGGRDSNSGRLMYEFAEGAVLALAERNRLDEADAFLAQAATVFSGFRERTQYIDFIRWRRGETAFLPMNPDVGDPDLGHYWDLEFQHAAGTTPAVLLPRLEAEERAGNQFTGLLWSLKAVLLEQSGAHDEARRLAAAALKWTEAESQRDVVARAHLALVRERARQLAR